jgi:hypothetical protein
MERKKMAPKIFCVLTLILLLSVSCKPEPGADGPYTYAYPPVAYTNNASWPVTVTNAAGEVFTLALEDSFTLPSGPRGRADIIEVRPPYAAWIQNNGDIYDIRFVDRDRFDLEIRNYSTAGIVLTEKNGCMDPPSQEVSRNSVETVSIYTDKPLFQLTGSAVLRVIYIDCRCVAGIDPPEGNWWEHDWNP